MLKTQKIASKKITQMRSSTENTETIEPICENLPKSGKILLYTYEFPPIPGGAGRYSLELASGLADLGKEVFVLTVKRDDSDSLNDCNFPFKIYRMRRILGNKGKLLGMLYFLYYYWKIRPACTLVTDRYSQQACGLASILLNLKYVSTVHGSEVLLSCLNNIKGARLRKYLFKKLCHNAKNVIAVSNYTKSLLIENKIMTDNIEVIPNGITAARFSCPANPKKVSEIKASHNINANDKVLLTLSVLKSRKGHDMVIQALSKVLEQFPNIKYVIAGCGSDLDRLRGLVHQHNLDGKVIFAGEVDEDDVIHYYDMCDVYVMPSRQDGAWVEGYGISFLEANAREKPVIGGRHGGVVEAIIDNETGILVEPNSPEEIAQAIIKLLSDEKLAKRMGENGRDRCLSQLNWKNIVKQTLSVIEK